MKALLRRIFVFAIAPPLALVLLGVALVGWARGESGLDIAAVLPPGCEATARLRNAGEWADLLTRATGRDFSGLARSSWAGRFGGAAAGVEGRDVVVVLECPRLTAFLPLRTALADALHLRPRPGGGFLFGERTVWLEVRGRRAFVSTSPELLRRTLARAGISTPLADDAPSLEVRDRGLIARIDRHGFALPDPAAAAPSRPGDLERLAWDRLRGALAPEMILTGEPAGDSVTLVATLPPTPALRPPSPLRLAATSIPGLAVLHTSTFSAPQAWHQIVHDPENGRFIDSFRREIEEYETFLGGRDFESDLLPRLGPEYAWAVARPDWSTFGVRPRTGVPVLLFGVEVRGIEPEVLKSLDKFLRDAELEGKRYDLPAPRGRTTPVLEPFSHDEKTVHGVRVTRILFRDGVSQFGNEVAPGYAIVDGVLWISTFWPILPKLAAGPPAPPAHAAGRLEGTSLRRVLDDLSGDIAEIYASSTLLDRVQPQVDLDFERRFGRPGRWKEAMIGPFTQLEKDLKRERPDLKLAAFDRELEERLKAWEAAEKRLLAQRWIAPLKTEESYLEEVAWRREALRGWIRLGRGLDAAAWSGTRGTGGTGWTLRVRLRPH
ncbi:MAG: hypothetical protein HUU15_05305 [Candidatus Brocadiae bacterium]|nr:hypothetical protein [Candidatus Brocadiia bacterium]